MTTQPKGATARKGGGSSAARAESKATKTVTFRKVELAIPGAAPGTLSFDLGDIALRAEQGDEHGVVGALHRILEELIGREQLLQVRPTIKSVNDPWQEELLGTILEEYKLDQGEA